jgi:hypothetical protein
MLLLRQISLLEQLVNLLICQFLPQVRHCVSELLESNGRALRIENGHHSLDELVFRIGLFVFFGHERQELREVDFTGAVWVDLLDPLLEVFLGGGLVQRPDHEWKLLSLKMIEYGSFDNVVAVFVEQSEGLLELSDLLLLEPTLHLIYLLISYK